jgi:sugar phosphate permease
MNSRLQLPPRAWIIVGLLWFTVVANYLMRALFTTMHDSVVSAIPMTEAQFGLLTSSLLWTYGIASPFAGFLADRFSRSRIIVIGLFLWSLTTWFTSFARSFAELALLRSLMGLVESCYMPAALALICDYHRGPTRSLAIAIHHTGYVLGLGLSGFAGWIAQQRTWHYTFALVGLIGVGYSVPLALWLRDLPRDSRGAFATAAPVSSVNLGAAVRHLLGRSSFVLLLTIHGLLNLVGWAVIGWAAVFLQERFRLTQGFAGVSTTGFMNGAAIVGLIAGGIWADRWSRHNRRARMFVPAIGLLASVPGILLLANTEIFTAAIIGLVVFCLFMAFYDPNTMPALCEVIDVRYRATGYGLLNFVGMIAGGLGIYVSGTLRDLQLHLNVMLDGGALLCVIGAFIYCFVRPTAADDRAAVNAIS